MTSRADVNLSPSSLSDARPEGPASVDGCAEWLATHGPSHPNVSSGTKTFAENVPTPRGASLRVARGRHNARIRALRAARRPEAGALERATPNNNFTPADRAGTRGGPMKMSLTVAEGAEYAGVRRD